MQKDVKIGTSEDSRKGRYANLLISNFSQEEFVFDFVMFSQQTGTGEHVSRIVSSPGHAKRIAESIKDLVSKYEKKFGKVNVAEEPKEGIGFRPQG